MEFIFPGKFPVNFYFILFSTKAVTFLYAIQVVCCSFMCLLYVDILLATRLIPVCNRLVTWMCHHRQQSQEVRWILPNSSRWWISWVSKAEKL